MRETPIEIAVEMVAAQREELVISAALLRRRLQLVEEHGGEGMGHDFPTIQSLLTRMRDSIETYRRAIAVEEAVSTALSAQSIILTMADHTFRAVEAGSEFGCAELSSVDPFDGSEARCPYPVEQHPS